MTIYDKIKNNFDEELELLSDKELLQLMLEFTHNPHPEKLADTILKDGMTFADIIANLDSLYQEKCFNQNFYIVFKVLQIYRAQTHTPNSKESCCHKKHN